MTWAYWFRCIQPNPLEFKSTIDPRQVNIVIVLFSDLK